MVLFQKNFITAPLYVEVLTEERNGRGLGRLTEMFVYDVGRPNSGDRIVVPVGYVTDFASVPWFARAFIPTMGKHAKAAVLHDFLIDEGKRSIKECHAIFDEAMKVCGVSDTRRFIIRMGLWIWSRFIYKRSRDRYRS